MALKCKGMEWWLSISGRSYFLGGMTAVYWSLQMVSKLLNYQPCVGLSKNKTEMK